MRSFFCRNSPYALPKINLIVNELNSSELTESSPKNDSHSREINRRQHVTTTTKLVPERVKTGNALIEHMFPVLPGNPTCQSGHSRR